MRLSSLLLAALAAAPLSAQAPQRPSTVDSILLAVPDTGSARRHSTALSARVHVAGTAAQQATAAYVLGQMASWGLDTSRARFKVYLPAPESVSVERITPTREVLHLAEPTLPNDPTSAQPAWPTVNGYSGAGDVTGPIVYVNYGLLPDYKTLDSLGVSVRGAIVVARYGRSHRGVKVREAERHGALAIILYSDPADDGVNKGKVFPDGPWRPETGVQRGSVKLSPGDPSTPGWAATANARRIPLAEMDIPHIPSVPMGYGNARELLTGLGGVAVPDAWKGGLPLDYHVGGTSAVTAHVTVRLETGERAYKWIANTFGMIRGSTWPNEVVIVGGHRDAWGPGAADNIAGTTAVLEAAHAWSAAVRAGHRPKRTLVFATWDAEEWGLIGSSEYVESREPSLRATTVAYLNQDMNATGRSFGASAAPTLRGVVRRATQLVPAPDSIGSIYDLWRRQTSTPAGKEPAMGNLGGGSDFAGFYNHLGIPAMDWGFGGGQGIYHSQYDDILWTSTYGDPGFRVHQANARVSAVAMEELADATLLPYDEGALAAELTTLATKLRDSATVIGMTGAPFDRILTAAAALGRSAMVFDSVSAVAVAGHLTTAHAARVNAQLREAERQLARPTGLTGRPWYRNLLYAADRDNGYADVPLPGISEALRDRDAAALATEVNDLATRIDAVRGRVDSATALLH